MFNDDFDLDDIDLEMDDEFGSFESSADSDNNDPDYEDFKAMEYLNTILGDEDDMDSFNSDDLTEEDEAVVFLEALRYECSDDEFSDLLRTHAYEMAMVGLVPDADVCTQILESMFDADIEHLDDDNNDAVTESVKKVVINDWKGANFSRIEKRTAIRMAKRDNFAPWHKYDKYRRLMIEERKKIYAKYLNKAKVATKQIIKNSKHKASSIGTPGGKSITQKMDQQIKRLDSNGRNRSAIKK